MHDERHGNTDYGAAPRSKTIPESEERLKDAQSVVDPSPHDVTEDESIREVEEAAGSEEGISARDDDLGLHKDVKEDREDNTEGRLPDIPPSAIKQ